MKKILASIALLAAFCACSKQEEITPADNTQETTKQIITATVNCPTKVSYSENTPGGGSGISSVWEEGDTFYAIQDGTTVVTFTIKSGAGSTSATFEAEADGVTAGTEWVAVLGKGATTSASSVNCSYSGQTGTISGLNKYNYVVANGVGTSPSFDFNNGTKLSYIVRIKVPAGTKCIEYTPCAYWRISSSENREMHYNTNAFAENTQDGGDVNLYAGWQPANTFTITLAAAAAAGQIVYLALPAINYKYNRYPYGQSPYEDGNLKDGVILTFLNDESANADHSWGTVIGNDLSSKGGLIKTMDCSAIEMIKRPTPSEAIAMTASYNRTGNPSFNVSGTVSWAPYNVGANDANEAGYYFQWGEIEDSGGGPAYSNYAFGSGSGAVTYNNSNYDGYNTLSVLQYKNVGVNNSSLFSIQQSRYDAARVLWGSAWRMPSFPEASGTAENSTYSLTSSIWTLTSKENSNSISFYRSNWKTKGYNDPQRPKPGSNGNQLTYDCACFWTATQQNRKCGLPGSGTAMMMGHNAAGSDWDWWDAKTWRERAVPIRAVLASSSVTVE
ncbi:MAG: hypothetical protein IKX45_06090 [Bacteroidales bacterium]|nr:hypothetical protein [Bacteroidales bacterium]